MSFWEQIAPPEDISTHGHLIDWLFNYTTCLNLFFFSLLLAGLLIFSYLYHAKRHPVPYFTYGNKKKHIWVVTLIGAAVFIFIDLNITRMSNNDMTKVFWNWPKSDEVVKIEVMGQQWMWTMRYPGPDGIFNTVDDIVTNNDLRIPAGRKILLQMTSKDVIHAFFIPNVRLKVDAIPGRVTRMWFDANKPGVYDIACAEMCGLNHYLMQARMTVYNPDDYQKWLAEAGQIALAQNDIENPDLFWGWKWE